MGVHVHCYCLQSRTHAESDIPGGSISVGPRRIAVLSYRKHPFAGLYPLRACLHYMQLSLRKKKWEEDQILFETIFQQPAKRPIYKRRLNRRVKGRIFSSFETALPKRKARQ